MRGRGWVSIGRAAAVAALWGKRAPAGTPAFAPSTLKTTFPKSSKLAKVRMTTL